MVHAYHPSLTGLELKSMVTEKMRAYLQHKHQGLDDLTLILKRDHEIIGGRQITISCVDRELWGYVWNKWVRENYRRQGLATLIEDETERMATSKGCVVLYGIVENGNSAAIAAIRKGGYREIEHPHLLRLREEYYPDLVFAKRIKSM